MLRVCEKCGRIVPVYVANQTGEKCPLCKSTLSKTNKVSVTKTKREVTEEKIGLSKEGGNK